ncbi:hypothetical protein FJY63_14065, partial [Candidatus Sumerlaeota bacterium]|nr:hypothetical protein [Candidatus Sumerlaeota bacterium]
MNQIASGGRLRNRFESLPAVAIAIIALALLIACVGLAQNLILSRLPAISAIVRFSQRYTIHPYSIGLLFALAAGIMLVGLAQPRLLRYHSMIATMLFVLAILIVVVGAIERNFFLEYNLQNNGKRLALLAIYAIGGSLAIIAAGIDLSVGSLIGLIAVFLPLLITAHGIPIGLALAMVLLLAVALGLAHGVLIAK